MIPKRDILKGCIISAICLVLLVMNSAPASAAPCTPCDTWGSIMCCFMDKVCACCLCTKNVEALYAFYLECLGGDFSISPRDILEGEYFGAYALWSVSYAERASAENATWGSIKSLFSAQ